MNLFQIAEEVDFCNDESIVVVISAIKFVFGLIQWAIPAVLIVLGTIDMFKAMASGDEKKTKEAQKTFGRRLIYAVVAFLIPFIINLVFSFVSRMIQDNSTANGQATVNDFLACWNSK